MFDTKPGTLRRLRNPAKHISATTGKLCIGHYVPPGGLHLSMLHPRVALNPYDILLDEDDVQGYSPR